MSVTIITEKEEVVNGFRVTTKKPDLPENEYKVAEYHIVQDIIKSLTKNKKN